MRQISVLPRAIGDHVSNQHFKKLLRSLLILLASSFVFIVFISQCTAEEEVIYRDGRDNRDRGYIDNNDEIECDDDEIERDGECVRERTRDRRKKRKKKRGGSSRGGYESRGPSPPPPSPNPPSNGGDPAPGPTPPNGGNGGNGGSDNGGNGEDPSPSPPTRTTVRRSTHTLTSEIQSALDAAGLNPLDLGRVGYNCVQDAIDAGASAWHGDSLANGVKELCCGSHRTPRCPTFTPGTADAFGIRTLCDNSKPHIDIGDYVSCVKYGSHHCKTGGDISSANCRRIHSTCSSRARRDQAHCVWEEALNAMPPLGPSS